MKRISVVGHLMDSHNFNRVVKGLQLDCEWTKLCLNKWMSVIEKKIDSRVLSQDNECDQLIADEPKDMFK